MLDFGWSETLVVIIVALFVIGPEDIPKVMVALGRVVRRFQYIKYAITQQFDDIMREADLDDLRKSVNFEARRHEEAIKNGDFDEGEGDLAHQEALEDGRDGGVDAEVDSDSDDNGGEGENKEGGA